MVKAVFQGLVRDRELLWRAGYAIIILAGCAAYANTFNAVFNFDDIVAILRNPAVTGPSGFDLTGFLSGSRAFGDLTFAINYRLHGTSVVGYHLVNLAIHIATACLIPPLVTVTLRSPWVKSVTAAPADVVDAARFIGFFSALLFVLHPVQTQAVTYIVQRYTSLAALLYLATLLLYAKARISEGRSRAVSVALYASALVSAVLAFKSKQIAFTLPCAVVLYELTFLTVAAGKKLWRMAVGLVAAASAVAIAVVSVPGGGAVFEKLLAMTREDFVISRHDYLITQFRVIVTYLRLLVAPVGQRVDYDYPVFRTFFTWQVILSFLLILGLAFLAVKLYMLSRDGGDPVAAFTKRIAAFGIAWFFLALSVESSLIPISDVIFEHRLYLPSVGAFIAGTALIRFGVERMRNRSRSVIALSRWGLAAAACCLGIATFQRNRVWASEMTLWQDNVRKTPNLSRPLNNLAKAYIQQNDPLTAIRLLVRANRLAPGYHDTWHNLAIALDRLGVYGDRFRYGLELVDERGRVFPWYQTEWFAIASNNLGLAYEVLGDRDAAIDSFEKAIRLRPGLAEAHFNLGIAMLARGDRAGAVEELRVVATLNPSLARKMVLWFQGESKKQ